MSVLTLQSRESIEALKRQWLEKPDFILECAPDFGAHVEELRAFRIAHELDQLQGKLADTRSRISALAASLAAIATELKGRQITLAPWPSRPQQMEGDANVTRVDFARHREKRARQSAMDRIRAHAETLSW